MFIDFRQSASVVSLAAMVLLLVSLASVALAGDGSEEARAQIRKALDTDGDGKISMEERDQARQKHRLKRFDTNGDGKIDADEQAAADKLRAEKIGAADTDGDGKLSRDERRAMHAEHRKQWIDADGDGTVSDREREAARMRQQKHRKEMTQKYDADGDGELSPEERATAIEAGEKIGRGMDPEKWKARKERQAAKRKAARKPAE